MTDGSSTEQTDMEGMEGLKQAFALFDGQGRIVWKEVVMYTCTVQEYWLNCSEPVLTSKGDQA